MESVSTLDGVVLGVMGLAIVRGLFIGLIREGFSIAALGGGLMAIRYGIEPGAALIQSATSGAVGATASSWIAGAVIGIAVIAAVGRAGRLLRRGAQAIGLGFADRLAGGVVGAAEGALAVGVILVATTWVAGAESELVREAKSIQYLEAMQSYVMLYEDELPEVASPGEWLR